MDVIIRWWWNACIFPQAGQSPSNLLIIESCIHSRVRYPSRPDIAMSIHEEKCFVYRRLKLMLLALIVDRPRQQGVSDRDGTGILWLENPGALAGYRFWSRPQHRGGLTNTGLTVGIDQCRHIVIRSSDQQGVVSENGK